MKNVRVMSVDSKKRLSGADDEFLPTRRSLLSRLRDWDDRESWREFFDTYWRLIFSVCSKCGLSDNAAQDVVQETILAVAKKMPGFVYDPEQGSFKAWLMRITRRRIADHFRKHPPDRAKRHVELDTALADELEHADPAPDGSMWDEEWQRNLMMVAMQRVKARVPGKHYQVFDLTVVKEWPVKDVMQTLQISRPQVYLIKHRISKLIQHETQRLERSMNQTGRSRA